jgi:Type I phosphodiesterase / nucleotide pyrophosphatase
VRKLLVCLILFVFTSGHAADRRVVILKVDGLPPQMLADFVRARDPATGLSRLPWIEKVFFRDGAWVKNFYSRGVSVSAPSWQVLETGWPLVIHGNVEYDRYTMSAYDYLNFFPFYFRYSRSKSVDMPIVETLDRLGIPFLLDRFAVSERYQGIQLFQRELRWPTVESTLRKRFTSRSPEKLFNEWQSGMDLRNMVNEQIARELLERLKDPKILYLDYFTPEFDHLLHIDNNPDSQYVRLRELDRLVGLIQTEIERSPLAGQTLFVVISDHGMNTSPDFFSQGFDLVKFFGSARGGGHHVVTNRHPNEAFKLKGLNPFVSAVITPAPKSSYLPGQQARYPTVLLDLDGNERASIYLRANALNRIHLLLQQLQRKDLSGDERTQVTNMLENVINKNRKSWQRVADELEEELNAVRAAIDNTRRIVASLPNKKTPEARRLRVRIEDWSRSVAAYGKYRQTLLNLLSLNARQLGPGFRIEDFVARRAMGDGNTIHDLQNYVTAFGNGSFRTTNYFAALASLNARNNVQDRVSNRPVDFTAVRIPRDDLTSLFSEEVEDGVWLYGDDRHQALIVHRGNKLRYMPVAALTQDADGRIHFENSLWGEGYPLHIWEDPDLEVPDDDRAAWLDEWHTETEWLRATHRTRYSNAVTSLAEYFLRRPAPDGDLVTRFEHRRRENTDADFLAVASDGWNFNVRGFNPGGNHGSFLRSSTRSTLFLSGVGIPAGLVIDEPYDGLSFVPTLLRLLGRPHDGFPGPFISELFAPAS